MRRAPSLLLCLFALPLPLSAMGYRIDSPHSEASFNVRLLWFDHVNGQFTQLGGSVLPAATMGTYVVDARIATDSVVMTSTHVRDWLLQPSFFDAKRFPVIHFVSDPVPQADLEQGGMLSGQLTLRGITAPMHFTLHPTGCLPNASAPCQLSLDGSLKRSTFGMTADRAALSDRVDLQLTITLQPEAH